MQLKGARSISPQGQEALRKRAVRAVLNGMKQTAAACTFSVARGTVARWVKQRWSADPRVAHQHPGSRENSRPP